MRYNTINRLFLFLILPVLIFSCRKDEFKAVDINDLNPDVTILNTELDQWLKTTFLDEYNVDVIYRYNRYNHEPDRNVTPPLPQVVQPMMQVVLDGYIMPYRKIGGAPFIKSTVPKQWVLYGSTSYDGSNTGYAGTASGGVRVNLFGLNSNSYSSKSRLNVIHHEYTHILNQLVNMPTDFPLITKSTYNAAWQSTPADSAKKWGYVSSYASQNPMEDYAETTAALLVAGQPWFDNYVRTNTSATGQAALRLKEQNVVGYFNSAFKIDFRALQKEIQLYIKDTLKDVSATFPYWINQGLYKTVTINLDDAIYSVYGISPDFVAVYNQFKEDMLATSTTAKYRLDYVQLRFDTPTSLVVRAAFTATGGNNNGTQFLADYSFSTLVNSTTGDVTFTKIAQATGTTFNNGNIFITSFTNTIQKFLTESTYSASWLPVNVAPSMYTKTGGFTQKANAAKYFWGVLGQ